MQNKFLILCFILSTVFCVLFVTGCGLLPSGQQEQPPGSLLGFTFAPTINIDASSSATSNPVLNNTNDLSNNNTNTSSSGSDVALNNTSNPTLTNTSNPVATNTATNTISEE